MNIYLFQKIIGISIILLQILIIGLILYIIFKKITKKKITLLENVLYKNGIIIVIFSLLLSFIGSIIFSDIYKIEPCKLCWIQRILLYPQILIMFFAYKRKDTFIAWASSFWMSIIGFFIALYQTIEQFRLINLPKSDCLIGVDASCSQINMLEFGYITFPVASLSIFLFIIIMYLLQKKHL